MAEDLLFFTGLHQPSDAKHFALACISINRLVRRKKMLLGTSVLVDSGAFTTLAKHGCYPNPPEQYAAELHRLCVEEVVNITIASTQDYMCEPVMLAKTGLTVADHQSLTVERYDAIRAELHRLFAGPPPFAFMPVLQGFEISDYLRHIEMYGDRLLPGMIVGVGSVCKRQGKVQVIEELLVAIKEVRPDLRLHGFRRKTHSFAEPRRSRPALQRRQHGVVVFSTETGARRKRLERGQGVRSQGLRPVRSAYAGERRHVA